jgi:hypothetical protein
LLIFITSWPLLLQGLWSVNLDEKITPAVWQNSLGLAFVLSGLGLTISLWPVSITMASLFLVSSLYVLLGLTQQNLSGRLFKKTVQEYLWVGLTVFVVTFFLAQWGN